MSMQPVESNTAPLLPAEAPREKAIQQIERWMVAEFLEQKITYFWGPGAKDNSANPRFDELFVYDAVLRWLRDLVQNFQALRSSLLRLAEIDGVDKIIEEELNGQRDRANKALRSIMTYPDKTKFTNGDVLCAYHENRIVQFLLIRAWLKCLEDPEFGLWAALGPLISDLLVQQQKSRVRIQEGRSCLQSKRTT